MTQILNMFILSSSNLSTNIVAVERLREYERIPEEVTPESINVPECWPLGSIEFRDFKVQYKKDSNFKLDNLNFSIHRGEKIGICGRTGAGKSTLIISLFRIIEAAQGKIYIDGVDISKIGLEVLRSSLTIIPQEPVLFTGALRMNLDPFNSYRDENLWHALSLVQMDAFVRSMILSGKSVCSKLYVNLNFRFTKWIAV